MPSDATVQYAANGEVEMAYETFGDPAGGEPLLLVMGLDFQMVWWPEELIDQLVQAGFAVVRFDNRDTGLSTHFPPTPSPSPWKALMGRTPPAYTAADMMGDALAVMDAVGWSSAHVMGGSMGAGLAQGLAMEHPDRVRSLVSCMGIPVDAGPWRTLRYIRPRVFRTLSRIRPGWARAAARTSQARAPRDPSTTQRQLAAGRAHRYPGLATITAPTLVVSGLDDPLIRWQGGRDTAARIPGARFVRYPGMGHNIPAELFPELVEEVRRITERH